MVCLLCCKKRFPDGIIITCNDLVENKVQTKLMDCTKIKSLHIIVAIIRHKSSQSV